LVVLALIYAAAGLGAIDDCSIETRKLKLNFSTTALNLYRLKFLFRIHYFAFTTGIMATCYFLAIQFRNTVDGNSDNSSVAIRLGGGRRSMYG
jgi:hypothetical protein